MAAITDYEADKSRTRTRRGRQPVVFVHGLWLLPNSWDRWQAIHREAGHHRALVRRNEGVTEIIQIPGRGHSLTIDHGWREVAESALEFVQRFVKPDRSRMTRTLAQIEHRRLGS